MVLPILILPQIFLVLGLFVVGLKALGWPIRPFLASAVAFYFLAQIGSTLITLVALAVVFKTCVLRRPLLDRATWTARMNTTTQS
jgi:hypothetical protein